MEDTVKTILTTYPQRLSATEATSTRYQTLRKLPEAFEKVGAVSSSEKLVDVISQILYNTKQEDRSFKNSVIQITPSLVKVLMQAPDSNENTRTRCVQSIIQPLSDFLVGSDPNHQMRSVSARAMVKASPLLDYDTFRFFVLPVVRGMFTGGGDTDAIAIEVVVGVLPLLNSDDHKWVMKGLNFVRKSEDSHIRKESLKILFALSEQCDYDHNEQYVFPLLLDYVADDAWMIRRDVAYGLPNIIRKCNEEGIKIIYTIFNTLLLDRQKQILYVCLEIIASLLKNNQFSLLLQQSDYMDKYKVYVEEEKSSLTKSNLIKVIPQLFSLFPNEEEYFLQVVLKCSTSEEESMRQIIAEIFGDVFRLAQNKTILMDIYQALENDDSDLIKNYIQPQICNMVLLDKERFIASLDVITHNSSFRTKMAIANQLHQLKTLDSYVDILEQLIMDGCRAVRQAAVLELKNYVLENEENNVICVIINVYNCKIIIKKVLSFAMMSLDDPIVNVQITAIIILGQLNCKDQDVQIALNQIIQSDRDDDIKSIALEAYNKLF
ncbi:HEAT repeat domain containing protein [Entamoeba marina]